MKEIILTKIRELANMYGIKIKSIQSVKGGLTNETYLLNDGNKKYIARIAGEGTEHIINRNDEYWNMKTGYKLGVSPELYVFHKGSFLIEYIDAYSIRSEEELLVGNTMDKIIDVMLKLHNSGAELKNQYDILNNIAIYKAELLKMKADYPEKLIMHEKELYNMTVWMLQHYKRKPVACHIDTIFGNILILEDRAVLIDWEYSGMSDVYCDLANFSLENDLTDKMEMIFLNSYFRKSGGTLDYAKFLLFKMAMYYMWVYWHLIKYKQFQNIEYNKWRLRERLDLALECKKRWEEMKK